jgi:hypothetical protein
MVPSIVQSDDMDQMEIPFPAHRERQEGSPPPFQDPLALLRSQPDQIWHQR